MDRLERELSRLRKLHAAFGRKDIGNRPELLWEDEAGNGKGEKNNIPSWTTVVPSFIITH